MARFVIGSMVLRGVSTSVLIFAPVVGIAEAAPCLGVLALGFLLIETACIALID